MNIISKNKSLTLGGNYNKFNLKLTEIKNVKNKNIDNFLQKINIQDLFKYQFIIIQLVNNYKINDIKNLDNYNSSYSNIVSYIYDKVENVKDKYVRLLYGDEQKLISNDILLKTNFHTIYTLDLIPYYSFLLHS